MQSHLEEEQTDLLIPISPQTILLSPCRESGIRFQFKEKARGMPNYVPLFPIISFINEDLHNGDAKQHKYHVSISLQFRCHRNSVDIVKSLMVFLLC